MSRAAETERICAPCRNGDHAECEPLPVPSNGLLFEEGTGYVDCQCLCAPCTTAEEFLAATDQGPGAAR